MPVGKTLTISAECWAAGRISVLTRRDLKIFLFVGADDVSQLVSRQIVRTPYKIVLQDAEQALGQGDAGMRLVEQGRAPAQSVVQPDS